MFIPTSRKMDEESLSWWDLSGFAIGIAFQLSHRFHPKAMFRRWIGELTGRHWTWNSRRQRVSQSKPSSRATNVQHRLSEGVSCPKEHS